jgi:tripartite ATP-independent transporter DctM subunit
MPQFRAYGYNLSLATGTLASAGTLAVLVPPSALMVIYGVWSETSIGDLFLAGIVPCLLLALAYCAVLMAWCALRPKDGPRGPAYPLAERIRSLWQLVPTLLVMAVVLGGIYGGVMTPAEAGGIGVAGVLVVAIARRRLTLKAVTQALRETTVTSGMVFAILVCGILFSRFMVHTKVTELIVEWISALRLGRVELLLALLAFYFILGTALDTYGMLILSLPFVLPAIVAAGINKVWFGVFVAVMVELAAVSPPVGITVAVMRSIAPDVPTSSIFRGCYPFLVLTILLSLALIWFPALALWLPSTTRS